MVAIRSPTVNSNKINKRYKEKKMADILYTYKNQVYANITNKCDCSCTFCIRSIKDSVGDSAKTLWHQEEPKLKDVKDAMDQFDFTGYEELVYCGYGEPTCALDTLLESAKYVKLIHPELQIRLNTNGLGNLYHKKNIIPQLAEVIDSVSISLNAPTKEKYQAVTRPQFENGFEGMLEFATQAKEAFKVTQLSIVDVLPEEEIKECQKIADDRGIFLKIRKYS